MTHQPKFNSIQITQNNPPHKNYLFQATTQQFKKYTTIEANRKIQSYSKNNPSQNPQSKPTTPIQLSFHSNKSLRQKHFQCQYLPSLHFNPRMKSKKHSHKFLLSSNINDTITIDDNSDNESNKNKNMNTIDKKFLKQNRSYSLKAYLDGKPEKVSILPKIGKTQNIIQIVKNEFKQAKQKKKINPRFRSIQQVTIGRQIQDQTNSQLLNIIISKNPSKKQTQRKLSSKKILQPLLQLDHLSNEKRKIQLMGMKLQPIQRQQSNVGYFFQNRTQKSGSLNLLSSELIYKNPKQSIQKNVYQQLMKRVFSSS